MAKLADETREILGDAGGDIDNYLVGRNQYAKGLKLLAVCFAAGAKAICHEIAALREAVEGETPNKEKP